MAGGVGVNDTAQGINPAPGAPGAPTSAPLALTDPDSNRYLPGTEGLDEVGVAAVAVTHDRAGVAG